MILKKGWFSDFKLLEICGQLNHEEYAPKETPKQTENQNIMESSTRPLMLEQDGRSNTELIKKKNHDWK